MDMAATAFLILLIVSLIVIPINKGKVRKGKVPLVKWDRSHGLHRILSKFPENLFLTSLIFGFFGLLIIVPLTLSALYALGITLMTPSTYSIFKGAWAGIFAGVMVWPIILYALGNAPAPDAQKKGTHEGPPTNRMENQDNRSSGD
ncbi:MAG: hypothetical protein GY849_02830 [Deltaproteobacteria bacterium]|nr:hypothetical protein [Deltaproteobacteria bacterium]